ncbi:MAG: high-affinity branched-chain amino acid ABC transporter substrate-binding protein [Cardiobacteriaceae bacterium]|nr:high-affinity branched-chain amino acid ABC transporter substrate-binding protein [Cardiobacteriaceae bacterium]
MICKKKITSAIAATMFSFASLSAFSADEIVIALAGPTTGPVTQYGTMQNIGAEMAAEQINAAGGINGKKIKTKIYDDACEAKQAVTVAHQIVNDKVKFVVGHLCSASTLPAAEIYEEEGIVMVSPASTDPALGDKGFEHIFRTIGTDSQSAPASAAYIADVLKPKKIALLHDKQQYGQGLAEGVAKVLKEKGIEPVILEGVNKGQTDFSALITKLKKAEIDFVYWGGYHPELGLIIRQGADQGFKPTYMGADGIDNQDIFAIAGKAADGLLATVPKNFIEEPSNAELKKAFEEKKQDPNGPFVLRGYAAMQVIALAANKAQSEDTDKVAEVLHKENFETPIGKIAFQKNGDLQEAESVIYSLKSDGSRELLTK